MIKQMHGTKLVSTCRSCEQDIEFDFKGIELKYLPEYDQYENLSVVCPCGTVEIFNMNIPENDADEKYKTGDIPVQEEIQRHYIRLIQRLIRSDFINKK